MRRGMILLGFWMCVCMVFLVNAQEHTSRKLYCTDEDPVWLLSLIPQYRYTLYRKQQLHLFYPYNLPVCA